MATTKANAERLTEIRERLNTQLEELTSEMDASHRCVSAMSAGCGVVKLKNGRRAEVQLHINTDKDEWIKGN